MCHTSVTVAVHQCYTYLLQANASSSLGYTTNRLQYIQLKVIKPLWRNRYCWPFQTPVDVVALNIPVWQLRVAERERWRRRDRDTERDRDREGETETQRERDRERERETEKERY